MISKQKAGIVCAMLIGIAVLTWMAITSTPSLTTYTYSQFLEQLQQGQVAGVVIRGTHASGAAEATYRLKNGGAVRTVLPSNYQDALRAMENNSVSVEIRDGSWEPFPLARNAVPFFVLLGIWIYLISRKFPNGSGRGRFAGSSAVS